MWISASIPDGCGGQVSGLRPSARADVYGLRQSTCPLCERPGLAATYYIFRAHPLSPWHSRPHPLPLVSSRLRASRIIAWDYPTGPITRNLPTSSLVAVDGTRSPSSSIGRGAICFRSPADIIERSDRWARWRTSGRRNTVPPPAPWGALGLSPLAPYCQGGAEACRSCGARQWVLRWTPVDV